ncbi:MAG: ribonuclease HI [Clostridia bacterium]|nr:ribonuclease HI [Clostridia bacterium]
MKKVTIYSDGACSGNPGAGGYGTILCYGTAKKEVSAGFFNTTNNRMELLGAITGLSLLNEPCEVELVTDSKYVCDGLSKGWARSWQQNGWRKADKKKAQNIDLWERLLTLTEIHSVSVTWVKGHAENEFNNRCDELAVEASHSPKFEDYGYEKEA